MDQEASSAEPKRIAVTQHLDALHMYDAAYHQRRQLDEAPAEDVVSADVKPRLVSWGFYLWTTARDATSIIVRDVCIVILVGLIALYTAFNLSVGTPPNQHLLNNLLSYLTPQGADRE